MADLPSWLSPLPADPGSGPLLLPAQTFAELIPGLLGTVASMMVLDPLQLRWEAEQLQIEGPLRPEGLPPGLPLGVVWKLQGKIWGKDNPRLDLCATAQLPPQEGVLKLQSLRFVLFGEAPDIFGRVQGQVLLDSQPPVSLPFQAELGQERLEFTEDPLALLETTDLVGLANRIAGTLRADLPALSLPGLEFGLDPSTAEVNFRGKLAGEWSVPVGRTTLRVQDPSFRIHANGKVRVEGDFAIGSLRGHLSTVATEPLTVQAALDQVSLGELVSSILPYVALPGVLSNLVLGRAALQLVPDTGAYTLEAEGPPDGLRIPLPILGFAEVPTLVLRVAKLQLAGQGLHLPQSLGELPDRPLELVGGARILGLPEALQKWIVPELQAAVRVDGMGLHAAFPRLVAPVDIEVPELGTAHLELSDLDLRLGRENQLTLEGGLGIPSGLNLKFGDQRLQVFRSYVPGQAETVVRMRFRVDPTGGLSMQLRSSPLKAMTTVERGEEVHAELDLGELGKARFDLPILGFADGKFTAKGSFERLSDMKPSMETLHRLLQALGMGALVDSLPHPNAETLAFAKKVMEHPDLPGDLRDWVHREPPEALVYDLALSMQGEGQVEMETRGNPVSMMLPALGPTGPRLVGFAIQKLRFGGHWAAPLSVLRVQSHLESFDLVPLLGSVLGLRSSHTQYWRRVVVEDLWVVSAIVAGARVVTPLFFRELGLSWRGLGGMEAEAHLALPAPVATAEDLTQILNDLLAFLSDPTTRLDPQDPPHNLDLRATLGPSYLRLPKVLGGEVLGVEHGLPPISAWSAVASALNGIKFLDLEEAMRAIPRNRRVGNVGVHFGPLVLSCRWLVTTPEELRLSTWKTIDLPEEQVAAVAGLLGDKGDRLAVVLRGLWKIGGLVDVDSSFGFVLTDQGLGSRFCMTTSLADGLFRMAALGALRFEPQAGQPLALDAQVAMEVVGNRAYLGELHLDEGSFSTRGELKLFVGENLGLVGHLGGSFGEAGFRLEGRGAVQWGAWSPFPEASFLFEDTGIRVFSSFLGQQVCLEAAPSGSSLRLSGPVERALQFKGFSLDSGGILSLNPELEPEEAELGPLGLGARVELFGMSSETVIRFGPKGFRFRTEGDLFGRYQSRLVVHGEDLQRPESFGVEGRFVVPPVEKNVFQNTLSDAASGVAFLLAEAAIPQIEAMAWVLDNLEEHLEGLLREEATRTKNFLRRKAVLLAWKQRRPGDAPLQVLSGSFAGGLNGEVRMTLQVRFLGSVLEDASFEADLWETERWGALLAAAVLESPGTSRPSGSD
jgi:hypothetical protein